VRLGLSIRGLSFTPLTDEGNSEISPSGPARTARVIAPSLLAELHASRLNAKFDETCSPEEVMSAHCHGYFTAHSTRVGSTQSTFDKQWSDEERIRPFHYGKLNSALDPVKRPKDNHVLEQVLKNREEGRRSYRSRGQLSKLGQVIARTESLPKEERAFERGPRRHFFY
jgi:hypothetical protein